jgi:hypothetical protein
MGIAGQQAREQLLHRMNDNALKTSKSYRRKYQKISTIDGEENLDSVSPLQHHHMSMDMRKRVELSQWLHHNCEDPVIKVPSLHYHIILSKHNLGFLSKVKRPPS